jgi:hypothetical protein
MDAARRQKEKDYPEPNMFGNTPAHGLLIRHAAGIETSVGSKRIQSRRDG